MLCLEDGGYSKQSIWRVTYETQKTCLISAIILDDPNALIIKNYFYWGFLHLEGQAPVPFSYSNIMFFTLVVTANCYFINKAL